MAKKSAIEKNQKRARMIKQYADRRAHLKGNGEGRNSFAGRAVQRPAEAGSAAAQLVAESVAAAVRADGSSAWELPEIPPFACVASRPRVVRADSRHGQVELVGGRRRCL